MHTRTNYAVTEVLSLVTVVIIASAAVTVVLLWAIPQLDAKKQSVRADSALTQFKTITDVIEDITSGGVNSSNLVDFVTDAGDVYLDSKGDRFIFYYSLVEGFDFNVSNLGDEGDTEFVFTVEDGRASSLTIYYLYSGVSKNEQLDSNPKTVKSDNNALADAIKIDVKNSSNIVIGRIWLFDSGYISYEAASGSGIYRFFAENGAAISEYSSGYLYHEPNFYNKDNSIVMKMIQLKTSDSSGGSGKGRYTFLIKSNAGYVREVKADIQGCFKMQIYGRNSKAWVDYFMREHGFKKYGSHGQDTLYLEGDRTFSLVQSICDAKLMVVTSK